MMTYILMIHYIFVGDLKELTNIVSTKYTTRRLLGTLQMK
jgi:hypothetical protein